MSPSRTTSNASGSLGEIEKDDAPEVTVFHSKSLDRESPVTSIFSSFNF